jgi:hypothetical protein
LGEHTPLNRNAIRKCYQTTDATDILKGDNASRGDNGVNQKSWQYAQTSKFILALRNNRLRLLERRQQNAGDTNEVRANITIRHKIFILEKFGGREQVYKIFRRFVTFCPRAKFINLSGGNDPAK